MHANPTFATTWHPRTTGTMTKLEDFFYEDKDAVKAKLENIKSHNKRKLPHFLKDHQGVEQSKFYSIPNQTFTWIQRQQMNALYVIHKYLDIKAGNIPARPITVFGKAAPAYYCTRYHPIWSLLVWSDCKRSSAAPHLQVVMVEKLQRFCKATWFQLAIFLSKSPCF